MQKYILITMALLLLFAFTNQSRAQLSEGDSPYNNPIQPKDETEEQILTSLEEMRREHRHLNVSVRDGRLLRILTESINA